MLSKNPLANTLCAVADYAIGVLLWVATILCLGIGFGLISCQTYEAAVAAPEEFWLTVETLLGALLADVWSLVELLL